MNWRKGMAVLIVAGLSNWASGEVVMDSDNNAATLTGTWTKVKTVLGEALSLIRKFRKNRRAVKVFPS